MTFPRPHRARTAVALGTASACTLLALVSCSNGGNGKGPATTSTPPAATSAAPAAARIVIENFAFSPANLHVRPGTKVTVVNRDSASHTVTATGDKAFDTGSIAGDVTATFTAPSAPGSYSYICTIHPTMKGTLTVG
ncbi:cupredoxin domain-containing protein [Streptomyces sp. HUAS TT20]|uniref:cupredoxin domain-containing protein n=1 Tax=Streptomyces sp. HUAS TT20 TaxID=3447509 RepID=UPI0021D879A2|nr:cupredoxin domain-containing protein [Streptomyces sp. HUAS 15-9]UXY32311.1 cupredoxin domain-containing protein [Streptomyces sp. HUAS 15-9]